MRAPKRRMCFSCSDRPLSLSVVRRLPLAPGVMLKLVPGEGKLEVRYQGPGVTPGYWRAPELTAAAFDEGGFFRSGDAVRFLTATECAGPDLRRREVARCVQRSAVSQAGPRSARMGRVPSA